MLCLVILCNPAISQPQTISKSDTLLTDVLGTLENTFKVVFTYRDNDVTGVKATISDSVKDLDSILRLIEEQTDLRFTILNKRYISIQKAEQQKVELCRILMDSETLQVIPYATVSYHDIMIESDELGKFNIPYNHNNELCKISHINYQTTEIKITDSTTAICDTIYLQPKFSLLNEVLIPDYILAGLDKLDGGILKFTTEDLPVLPGLSEPDVFFSMQSLPGINSSRESVSDINIRGGRNDQNLILWNGIRMYQTGHFFGLISLFNPYFINNVTLTKNGTDPKYDNSVSGVIDLKSPDNIETEFNGQAGINLLGTDLNLHMPVTSNTSVHLSGRRSLSNLLITPTYKRYFNRAFRNTEILDNNLVSSDEDFKFSDLALIVNKRFDKKRKLQLSFLNATNQLKHLEKDVVQGKLQERESSLTQKNIVGGASFENQFSMNSGYSSGLTLSSYFQEAINQDISNEQTLLQINDVLDLGFYFRYRTKIAEDINLSIGYEFNEKVVENTEKLNKPEFNQKIKEVLSSNILHSQLQYFSPSSKISAKAGVRMTYYNIFNQLYIEPRFTVNYQLSNNVGIELLAEKKHQAISQVIDLQTDFLGVIKSRWVLANDIDLPFSESGQLSLGVQFDNDKLLVGTDLFYRQVNGIITSGEGFRNQFEFVRAVGKQQVFGLEFLLNKSFKRLNTWLSYAVLHNTNNFSTLVDEDFPSNQNIVHQLTLGAGYKSDRLELSSGINMNTGGPFTEPLVFVPVTNNAINFQSPNSSRLETYLRLDFSARYQLNISSKFKSIIGVSLWNLTASRNEIERYFRLDSNLELKEISGFALKFTPNLMIRMEF